MALEKNLANCSPRDFLLQTNKIRKSAERWLKATDIVNIRKNVPKLNIPSEATPEETTEIMAEYRKKLSAAARKNVSEMLDQILESHPDETLELLALVCFVDPKDIDNYKMTDFLLNITEVLEDEAVLSFFTSLIRWGQSGILKA